MNRRFVRRCALVAALAAAAAMLLPEIGLAQEARSIRVVGSSTMYPFATQVAERFSRRGLGRAPVIEATGTGGGIKLFCAGLGLSTPDIVTASRPMVASEKKTCRDNDVSPIIELPVGLDGIVVAKARGDWLLSLDRAQLRTAIAANVVEAGTLVNNPYRFWNEIDPALPNIPIRIYGPPPTSGTRDVLTEVVMSAGCSDLPALARVDAAERDRLCGAVREDGVFVDSGENEDLVVHRLWLDPKAVGIVGFGTLETYRERLDAASIDGMVPEEAAILTGAYPLARKLRIYAKAAHLNAVPDLRGFLDLFLAEDTIGLDGFLAYAGLVPLSDNERAANRERLAGGDTPGGTIQRPVP